MSPAWSLAMALTGSALVLNAARPRRGPWLIMPSWLAAFLTTDLAPFHAVLAAAIAGLTLASGGLESRLGQAALVLISASLVGLAVLWLPAARAPATARKLANAAGLDPAAAVPRRLLVNPFGRRRDGVTIERNIEFSRTAGRSLRLDAFRPGERAGPYPALVYFHGGGWLTGDKRDQGLPLCLHLAANGWVCFNANYRLSPGATWPDQLNDAKAAIAWVRDNAAEFGVDPGFIALAGGSAGAQIAAMAALTADDGDLQPGFEEADTRVQAVLTSYGLYDLSDRLGLHNRAFLRRFVGPLVIKAFPETEPEAFLAASPVEHVCPQVPPWLVLHGRRDTLAPAAEARLFVERLAAASRQAVLHWELPGAHHAFDVYHCHRSVAAVELSARFLATCRAAAAGTVQEK